MPRSKRTRQNYEQKALLIARRRVLRCNEFAGRKSVTTQSFRGHVQPTMCMNSAAAVACASVGIPSPSSSSSCCQTLLRKSLKAVADPSHYKPSAEFMSQSAPAHAKSIREATDLVVPHVELRLVSKALCQKNNPGPYGMRLAIVRDGSCSSSPQCIFFLFAAM